MAGGTMYTNPREAKKGGREEGEGKARRLARPAWPRVWSCVPTGLSALGEARSSPARESVRVSRAGVAWE